MPEENYFLPLPVAEEIVQIEERVRARRAAAEARKLAETAPLEFLDITYCPRVEDVRAVRRAFFDAEVFV